MLPAIANHLWQSTVFAAVCGLLTLLLNTNHARTRHALWLVASLKFLVPFSLLIAMGSHMEWRHAPTPSRPGIPIVLDRIGQPFADATIPALPIAAPATNFAPSLLLTLWLCGSAAAIASWTMRWRRVRKTMRLAHPIPSPAPIRVLESPALLEPGVFGIFRPAMLLPEGIADRLTQAQLEAVIAHELCHVRRRDNLAALVHMLVEAAFWFHPLVWWIGARLTDERERACDEAVLGPGSDPQVYAESILKVCEFYLASPLVCVSGISGADLKRRIEDIMTHRITAKLSLGRKLLLAAMGTAAVAGPIVIGLLHAPAVRAQSPEDDTAKLEFEVASMKPNKSGPYVYGSNNFTFTSWTITNTTLHNLIDNAYQVSDFQISGAPGW